jgi:hypothetical protein
VPVVRAELRVQFSVVIIVTVVAVVLVTVALATITVVTVAVVTRICGQFFLYPQGFSGFPQIMPGFGKCRRWRLA